VLLCAALVGSLRRRDAETGPVPTRAPEGRTGSSVRRWAGIAASAVVLVASVALARELVPVPAERFTLLAFVDSKPFSATVNAVAPRARVRLNWVLRAYGAELATGLTTVAVRMDGRPVEQVAVDLEPVTPSDGERGTAELKGAVTVTAPVRPGRHSVQLVVTPSNPDGTDLPPPGPVTTDLEVRR
jgi:hypothetical protein